MNKAIEELRYLCELEDAGYRRGRLKNWLDNWIMQAGISYYISAETSWNATPETVKKIEEHSKKNAALELGKELVLSQATEDTDVLLNGDKKTVLTVTVIRSKARYGSDE